MPQKQHRILVIGGGSIGERHLRCFQKTERADVSMCEINADLRATLQQRYQLGRTFESIEQALDDNWDAAIICTPAQLHIPMACQLAERGIHLLIEKPLSTSVQDVDQLIDLIAQKELSASVAYVYRAHPALNEMRNAIASGRFGRPVEIVSVSGQHFPFYRPAYREIYYTRHETGGGAIQDALTHALNAGEWLVGPITRLTADADHCVLEGVDVEDTVHMLTRHSNILGSFNLNQHQPPNESSLTVICDRGAARFQMHAHCWLSCTEPGSDWQVESRFILERDDLFIRQANQFLDVLEHQAEPACSVSDALQTLKVNLAALESVNSRQWIEIR